MKRILIAYDGDEPARRALERGAELAQAFGAELGVVSVSEHLATNSKATAVIAR